ncbi:hypothetical protein BH18ACT15_BH18ACT15_06080 [soil metagenome]
MQDDGPNRPEGGGRAPLPTGLASGTRSRLRELAGALALTGLGPLWRKAPFVLVSFPQILVAVLAAAFVLAMSSAAYPLFLSSTSSAVLAAQLEGSKRWTGGLQVVDYFGFGGPAARARQVEAEGLLLGATQAISHLGRGALAMVGSDVEFAAVEPQGGGRAQPSGTLLARTGWRAHIEVVERGRGPGVWLARTTARELAVKPGDRIEMTIPSADSSPGKRPTATARIAGIYEDLALLPRLPAYWSPLSEEILPSFSGVRETTPPPFLITGADALARIERSLRDSARFQWDFPVVAEGLTTPAARRIEERLSLVESDLNSPVTALGKRLRYSTTQSLLGDALETADEIAGSVRGPVGAITVAGVAVALLVVAAAGVFGMQRRRTEVTLLSARGVTPTALGARAALEAVPAVVVGSAAGWVVCRWLTTTLGPSATLDGPAQADALRSLGVGAGVALVTLAVMAARSAIREGAESGRLTGPKARGVSWEFVVLVLAAAAWYEIRTRGPGVIVSQDGAVGIDTLTLLFPALFVAGAAALGARLLGRLYGLLRRVPTGRWPLAAYLAARRLSAAPRSGLLLVSAVTLAVGILAYAGILTSSLDATAQAKAKVFVGSDVAAEVTHGYTVVGHPQSLPYPSTIVAKLDDVRLAPGDFVATDILAIDPRTFASAAYWDGSFAAHPLSELLALLEAPETGRRLPVIVVGRGFPTGGTLDFESFRIPVTEVASAQAWPGLTSVRPLLVTTERALNASFDAAGANRAAASYELWLEGDSQGILKALAASPEGSGPVVTADEVRATPALLALRWTLGFLQALGLFAGLVALVGVLLYLQARQRAREMSYVLSRRMGLRRREQRGALRLELAGLLLPSFALAFAFAALATQLVYRRLDPIPTQPPASLFVFPDRLLGFTAIVMLALVLLSAWTMERSAARTDVAELMRLAE